jgi:hypothetical protein
MAEWEDAPDLLALARRVIEKREEVMHVDTEDVLFLWELETKPRALAMTYSFRDYPIGFFTPKRFGIVFFRQNCDYMTDRQLALLMFHELMHIPPVGNKLVRHNVQDFITILRIDLDWANPGREVPDILE